MDDLISEQARCVSMPYLPLICRNGSDSATAFDLMDLSFTVYFYHYFTMLMTGFPQLPLHEWACLRTELQWIYDHSVQPGSRKQMNNRTSGNWVWYLRQGRATVTAASTTHHLKPGMWLFLPEGESHHLFSPDAHVLSIHFHFEWPSGENVIRCREGLLFNGADYPKLLQRAVHLERVVSRFFIKGTHYAFQTRQPTDGLIFLRFQALFLTWLEIWIDIHLRNNAEFTRLRSGDDRPLRAARCLNASPLDQGFPRLALLAETGLSEVHLNRLFLNEFGLSPRKCWDKRRLEFAKNCLETSLMPVKEISYLLGFRSDAHFAVWFRRLTGQRPGECRTPRNDM